MINLKTLIYSSVLSILVTPAFAGGPLVLEGPAGTTPVSYPNGVVRLNFDQGLLLNNLTNQQTDDLLTQAFALWNNVATADVQITQSTDLSQDIDVSNYAALLPNGSSNDPSFSDGISPIIYDNDGQVIDDFFGAGNSDNVAGFAASVFFVGGSNFEEGYAVLNGKASLNLNSSDVVTLVTHEIGHLIGMDHSQLDIDNTETDVNACSTAASRNDYPIMYPFLCRIDLSLHEDDEAAVTALYPVLNINQQLGQLKGFFVDTNGNAILGANLIATETTTGKTYSIVSDYLKQGNGFFNLFLPAGNYTLQANSINPIFFEASGVGPYADTATAQSFQNPITAISYSRDTASPVALTVATGLANEVKFVSDGTGTDSGGQVFSNPNTASDSSGGGWLAYSLLLYITLLGLRRADRKS